MTRGKAEFRADEVLAHLEWVRRLARRLVVDPSAADDVAQEAWVAALSRPWPAGGGPARAWLARVATNAARRLGRREGVRRGHERSAASTADAPPTDELLRRAELQRRLVDLVLELREPYRDVLLLRYFEGLAPDAIARRRRLPIATVKTQLRRGLELLRERLDRDHGSRRGWLLALTPLVRNGGPLGAASTGALIVSSKVIVGALVAAGAVLVAGVWWSGRGVAPGGDIGADDAAGAADLAAADPAATDAILPEPAPVGRAEVEPQTPGSAASGAPAAPGPGASPPAAPGPGALELALEEALASFRTEIPRVEELRHALAELGRAAAVDRESLDVDAHGVLRGDLVLPTPGVRGSFQRGEGAWKVELALGAAPGDPDRHFGLRTVSLAIPDDLATCQATVQHHPNVRHDLAPLFARDRELIVGWNASTNAESGTRLNPIAMTPGPDGRGVTIGRVPEQQATAQERPWDADRSSYRPWADLLRPLVP
jgi:RNA polymerase sigma-70 factor (ECF subfamily)